MLNAIGIWIVVGLGLQISISLILCIQHPDISLFKLDTQVMKNGIEFLCRHSVVLGDYSGSNQIFALQDHVIIRCFGLQFLNDLLLFLNLTTKKLATIFQTIDCLICHAKCPSKYLFWCVPCFSPIPGNTHGTVYPFHCAGSCRSALPYQQ